MEGCGVSMKGGGVRGGQERVTSIEAHSLLKIIELY